MKLLKRWMSLLMAMMMAVSLSGCTIPMPGFSDYDVTSYVKALLDSSYHAENEDLIAISGSSEEAAMKNSTDTIENAAVIFCNNYGLYPSDTQLDEIRKVMKQAYALTKYTVKGDQKTDTGYYLEVEISPITNFSSRSSDFEKLKQAARQEADRNQDQPQYPSQEDSEVSTDENGNHIESAPGEPVSEPSQTDTLDANSIYIDMIIDFCRDELKSLVFETPVTIALEIRQTEKGELQLDMNQIGIIDKTVVYLTK